MTSERGFSNISRIPKLLKYLLLLVAGLIIILCCSLFQDIDPVVGEYHYSRFLQGNYFTIPAVTIFFIIGLGVGYFWKLNPWLTGLCLFFIFPLTSIIEATVYKGSHNLIPFEFIFFFLFAMPSIVAVYIGSFIFKQAAKRKEKVDNKGDI
jgi:hypothetical protein